MELAKRHLAALTKARRVLPDDPVIEREYREYQRVVRHDDSHAFGPRRTGRSDSLAGHRGLHPSEQERGAGNRASPPSRVGVAQFGSRTVSTT